ncbi:MAG: hypothetical protein GY711_05830 [bacterium]|nr:hypothetical protein [bacterium]
MTALHTPGAVALLLGLTGALSAQTPPGEQPALGSNRITQADITGGGLTVDEVRAAGQKIFSTPFNKLDGYGDGPVNPSDTTSPGGRPTLQNNGTFLRINGLDAQTCMECHAVGSNAVAPFRFAVGGVGGANTNAMFMPREIDVDDEAGNGFAGYDGRFINPPFLFGSGGVELAAKEMTEDLQRYKLVALSQPDTPITLLTHGVSFGTLRWDSGSLDWDLTQIEGIEEDLVVRPFGRKGEFPTVRAFDVGAFQFHFGMQPVEAVGPGNDGDNDGVADEILIGELSALQIFNATLRRPQADPPTPDVLAGEQTFGAVGCAECHTPEIRTRRTTLPLTFPENERRPFVNAYYQIDLVGGNAGFDLHPSGGMVVPLYSDLKIHSMGPELEESFGSPRDGDFVTARLWGIADTAPYLHDGRATTLTEAILLHGGEGQTARDAFDALPDTDKIDLLTFLRSLRTPVDPTGGL